MTVPHNAILEKKKLKNLVQRFSFNLHFLNSTQDQNYIYTHLDYSCLVAESSKMF